METSYPTKPKHTVKWSIKMDGRQYFSLAMASWQGTCWLMDASNNNYWNTYTLENQHVHPWTLALGTLLFFSKWCLFSLGPSSGVTDLSHPRILDEKPPSCVGTFEDVKKTPRRLEFLPQPGMFSKKRLPSGKLTWQWKMSLLKTYSLLKMGIFHCHVSLLEGNNMNGRAPPSLTWNPC